MHSFRLASVIFVILGRNSRHHRLEADRFLWSQGFSPWCWPQSRRGLAGGAGQRESSHFAVALMPGRLLVGAPPIPSMPSCDNTSCVEILPAVCQGSTLPRVRASASAQGCSPQSVPGKTCPSAPQDRPDLQAVAQAVDTEGPRGRRGANLGAGRRQGVWGQVPGTGCLGGRPWRNSWEHSGQRLQFCGSQSPYLKPVSPFYPKIK